MEFLVKIKMSKKIVGFLLAITSFLISSIALSETVETKIIADKIIAEPGVKLFAEGNVKVQHGENIIEAEALYFNQKTNELKFSDIKEFGRGKSIRLTAEEAIISNDFSEGIIRTANLLLDDAIKIQTDKVRLRNGEILSAEGVSRVTSCKECDGRQPKWHLTASSAKRDSENSNIVYKNVTVRVRGFPIAYVPYIRMPNPSVDRAKGFLVPEAVLTSNLATGIKLPYFIPVGLSSDLLITPYFSSKTKTLEYRVRKKFINGDLTVNGAFSDDDLKVQDLRYFSQLIGQFKLGYGVDLNFNAGKVGDNSYLGDYAFSEESDFNSEISLGKTIVEKKQFFDGDLSYMREKEQDNSLNEYYSLSGLYVKNFDLLNLPGNSRLSANLNSSVNVNDDNSISRPPSSAQIALEYNQENFIGPIKFSTDLYGNYNSFVNSADVGTTNEEFSFQYGISTLISSPYFIKKKDKSILLTPRFSLSLNDQENDILGDYFKGPEELSWGSLYSGKKISSLTESEIGLSFSLGIEKQVSWVDGQKLEVLFAAAKIDDLTYSPNASLGIENRKMNYIGKFSYLNKHANSFSADALFSSKGNLLKGELKSKHTKNKFILNANYEFFDKEIDSRLSEDLRNINFTSSYNLIDDFYVSAGGHYDLNHKKLAETSFGLSFDLGPWEYNFNQEYLKQEPEKFSLSAVYDDECTRLTFSFENRYQGIGSSKPVKSLMFRVQLKPFANVVFSQGGDQITF